MRKIFDFFDFRSLKIFFHRFLIYPPLNLGSKVLCAENLPKYRGGKLKIDEKIFLEIEIQKNNEFWALEI